MDPGDDSDNLFRCAVCGLSEGDSSNVTQSSLQTNATVGCGHQFCTACVERELSRRKIFPCPICETIVKRVTLSTRTLDDVQCERDTSWRRRVLRVYNKAESDFADLRSYNDYLEEVEDIIFSIVNEEANAEECRAKVRRYEEENRGEIVLRQSSRADEDRLVADRIAAEQRESRKRKKERIEEEYAIQIAKRRYKQEATQVRLGEREEVSGELVAARMAGYRNEMLRQQKKKGNTGGPSIRPPVGGLVPDRPDRELYRKRQIAGGAILRENVSFLNRNLNYAVNSLFSHKLVVNKYC